MKIIWYRNNVPIKISRDLTLAFDGQLCKLMKDRCEKENDGGTYRITAVNSVGQAESVCQVTIQSNDKAAFRERLQSTRSMPVFTQTLQDKTFKEGEQLTFQVRANGQPKPQIIWYKDNHAIKNSQHHKVNFNIKISITRERKTFLFLKIRIDNENHILEISSLSINDTGLYQVKAINSEGEAKCSAVVNVLPVMIVPEPMIIETHGYSPEFLQLFKDQKSSIGSTVRFEARLTGTQPLNVNYILSHN